MASDPGLLRLLLAARGTLSVALTTATAVLAARWLGVAATELAGGVTLSMMAPFLMREPTLRQRQITLAVLALPAIGAAVLTALLHGRSALGDSVFLLLIFGSYLVGPRNARGTAIGLVVIITTYVGLYLALPPRTLPLQIAGVIGAVPVIALACFFVLPLNPAHALRRTVRAIQWRSAAVLHSARELANRRRLSGTAALRRDLVRLNEATLTADDLLAQIEPEGCEPIRNALIDLELATSRLIDRLPDGGLGERHATRLRLHERRMRRGHPYRLSPDRIGEDTLLADLVALGSKVHRLGAVSRNVTSARKSAPPPAPPPGPLAWMLAARVTLAAALAMVAGIALSPDRWFWAVITVYVVFINTRTRGDLIYKGFQRIGGTVLGIASGLGLSLLFAGNPWLEIGALLLAVFGMFYLFLASYTAGIFCVTVMLGLLYGLLGAPMEETLLLRLEETAIGAGAGMLIAAFVWPIRTREQVLRSGQNVLVALLDTVTACRGWLDGDQSSASPLTAVRRLDRQVADLRLALAPLVAGRALFRRSRFERPVPALLDCVRWARALAAYASGHPSDRADHPAGQANTAPQELVALENRLTEMASRVAKYGGLPTRTDPDVERGELDVILNHLEASVDLLEKRIKIGELEGFSLGH